GAGMGAATIIERVH
ncbi:MAG: hypothetical protein OXD42_01500, partial [Rhodospirillaceae bacterium]|nr:hypothetical protein [Rhodospirillaceae bacterium]